MIMDVEALLEESSRREIGRPQVAPPSWSGQQNYDIKKFELFFEKTITVYKDHVSDHGSIHFNGNHRIAA